MRLGACSAFIGARASPGPPGRIVPTDRRAKAEWIVPSGQDGGAARWRDRARRTTAASQARPEASAHHRAARRDGGRPIGQPDRHPYPRHPAGISRRRAGGSRASTRDHARRRKDLRDVPLVTIDGEDARDFDDAVYAERRTGFRLVVAIADVAQYVRPGSALDHAARTRGNSVYFPDRVVPMLPEALSNGWCSLRPDEDRGCLFVELHIDADGRKTAHRFGRGLMRSAARLTYEEVQRRMTRDDRHDPGAPVRRVPRVARRPHGARHARSRPARNARWCSTSDGTVASVAPRPRLDSHRLIEEFMVLANVAAAEELERLRQPCMYRVHAPPSDEKLASLRDFLHGLGISLMPGNQVHPRDLDRVLRRVAGTPEAPLVNEVMLRSQSQAAYSPDNIGHFGLALPRYAHFTSPIRRYADLLVHRALISGLRLGDGELPATRRSASPRPRCTSPRPNGAPSSPNVKPSTVTWLHTWSTRSARVSQREFQV